MLINLNMGLYVILISLYVLCFYEFAKFFYILNFIQDSEIQLLGNNQCMQNLEIDQNLKIRTLNFYIYLFNILKFWHIIFILLCFVFFLNNYLFQNRFSIDLWAINFQNFLFLYLFNLLSMWYIIKQYLIVIGQNVYFWFYLTQNKLSSYYSILTEILLVCTCSIK